MSVQHPPRTGARCLCGATYETYDVEFKRYACAACGALVDESLNDAVPETTFGVLATPETLPQTDE